MTTTDQLRALDKEADHHKTQRHLHEPTLYTLANVVYPRNTFSRTHFVVPNVEPFGPLKYINSFPEIYPKVKCAFFFFCAMKALGWRKWSASCLGRSSPAKKSSGFRRVVGWVVPIAVRDDLKKTETCFTCQESKCDFCPFGSLITPPKYAVQPPIPFDKKSKCVHKFVFSPRQTEA